jgi:hypothetical protein
MMAGGFQDERGDTAGAISNDLVRQVSADPRADELLRKVMADNGLVGEPGELPSDMQRAIVEALVRDGIIGVSG